MRARRLREAAGPHGCVTEFRGPLGQEWATAYGQ